MHGARRIVLGAALAVAAIPTSHPGRAAEARSAAAPTILRLDPRLDALVPPGATLEKIADGFAWVEGPVWDRRRRALLFSDIPGNAVHAWREGSGTSVFLRASGYTSTPPFAGREPGSNGLTVDTAGRLVLCQHGDRRIARLEPDGHTVTLADRYQGKRFNSPNDLVYASTTSISPIRRSAWHGPSSIRRGSCLSAASIVSAPGVSWRCSPPS
jgi:gluconolactonase